MRGLVKKSKTLNCAELTQPIFKEELDDLFFIGLNTSEFPEIYLLIEGVCLTRANFLFSDLSNIVIKNSTLSVSTFNYISFYTITLNEVCFNSVKLLIFRDDYGDLRDKYENIFIGQSVIFNRMYFLLVFYSELNKGFKYENKRDIYLSCLDKDRPRIKFIDFSMIDPSQLINFLEPVDKKGNKLMDVSCENTENISTENISINTYLEKT
jgi:hypothetical protein